MFLNKPNILIHSVGDGISGLGHVMRCCTLANLLIKKFNVAFNTRFIESNTLEIIKQNLDKNIQFLNNESEIYAESAINIFDGYEFE